MAKKGYRYEAIRAANDLFYGKRVVELIQNAKSDEEIYRIMCTARESKESGMIKGKSANIKRCLDRNNFSWC